MKTGFIKSENGDTPLEASATVKVEPPEAIEDVVISEEGNSDYITITEGQPDTNSGTLEVTVKGLKATPAEQNPLKLKATIDNQSDDVEVRVIVPTRHTSKIGAPSYTNKYTQAGAKYTLTTKYIRIATLTFFDQYGEQITDIYDGNKVVIENFSNTKPQRSSWPDDGPVKLPSGDLASGEISDELNFKGHLEAVGSYTPEQQAAFEDGTALVKLPSSPTLTNSIITLFGAALQSADIDYEVQGHSIETTTTRTQNTLPGDVPPIGEKVPFEASDQVK